MDELNLIRVDYSSPSITHAYERDNGRATSPARLLCPHNRLPNIFYLCILFVSVLIFLIIYFCLLPYSLQFTLPPIPTNELPSTCNKINWSLVTDTAIEDF